MSIKIDDSLRSFLEIFKLEEAPMATYFAEQEPEEGFSPVSLELPTVEKEAKGEVDWESVFSGFSCAMQKIWLARIKHKTAYFSAEQFGCVGAAYYFGYVNPLPETIIRYLSSGIPNVMEGERYVASPDTAREMLKEHGPHPEAFGKFCVFKPLVSVKEEKSPELVTFFVRGEVLSGLHRLVTFVTNDPEAVVSPWCAACGSLVGIPLRYKAKGLTRAIIGGMDPSARKYFKKDELTFTVPFDLFVLMLEKYEDSFLTTKTWKTVQKKI